MNAQRTISASGAYLVTLMSVEAYNVAITCDLEPASLDSERLVVGSFCISRCRARAPVPYALLSALWKRDSVTWS